MSPNETVDLSETVDMTEWNSLERLEESLFQAHRIEELEADAALWEEERNRERAIRILAECRAAMVDPIV